MTTVRQATREPVAPPRATPDTGTTRQARRHEHRRLVREEVAAVLVLAALLVATLVLLGLQWLDTGTPTSASSLLRLPGGIT